MKNQLNYIRACFCKENPLSLSDLKKLAIILDNHGCHSNGPLVKKSGHWIEQPLTWQFLNQDWGARLFQISLNSLSRTMISFDIDSLLFLPGNEISYHPNSDPLFDAYKHLIVDIILTIKPFIGILDYDADLLCGDLRINTFAAWGNFLSDQFFRIWDPQDIKILDSLVDEYVKIEKTGLLTFNHPLGYGDTTEKQIKFWKFIESYLI